MKSYTTIPLSELHNLDYSQLKITSADTAPLNVAKDTALIKWIGDMPSSVIAISTKGETLDYAGALALLSTPEWQSEEEM